jgi:hypothetical protein
MGEALIPRKNSQSNTSEQFASIIVTYPEGSTCTCTQGTIVLTAPNTNGQALFNVPNSGTWSISCTDGTTSKNEEVSIAKGQIKEVELFYDYYIFKSGNGYQNGHSLTKVAGTMTVAEDLSYVTSKRVASNSPGRAYFDPQVDITKYSTLEIDYVLTAKTSSGHFGLVDGASNLPTGSKSGTYISELDLSTDLNTRTTATLSLEGITGYHYVAWSLSWNINIYNLRLY